MQRTVVERFYHPEVGKDYAVDRAAKEHLVDQFKEITERVPSGTSWLIHVVLAQAIMEVPRAQEGIVVECGVYKRRQLLQPVARMRSGRTQPAVLRFFRRPTRR